MYMDCSFDGEVPERSKVLDHTPTEEEWKKILACFPKGKAKEIVSALHRTGNTPLEKDANPAVVWSRIGGMNAALRRSGLPFRLKPAFSGQPWDNLRLERQGVSAAVESPPKSEERVMRCCN